MKPQFFLIDLHRQENTGGECASRLSRLCELFPDREIVLVEDLDILKNKLEPDLFFLHSTLNRISEVHHAIRSQWSKVPILGLLCGVEHRRQDQWEHIVNELDEFVTCPIAQFELCVRMENLLRCSSAVDTTSHSVECIPRHQGKKAGEMIGKSPIFLEVLKKISLLARSSTSVLITGESGTGKELVAKAIYEQGPRKDKPFVPVNCGALPDQLLENELFGHARGAFTGAHTTEPGLLAVAHEGTLFLDEVDSLSPMGQTKLLRFLEEGEYRPLGSTKNVKVNVRIIAATNQDLELLMMNGKFRIDLYFRLKVAALHIPPLRERKEDIPLFFHHFLQAMNRRHGGNIQGLTREAMTCLLQQQWTGNIRELKNFTEALLLNEVSERVTLQEIPQSYRERVSNGSEKDVSERDKILAVLHATKWNKSKAAHELHWSRMTLYRKLARYKLVSPQAIMEKVFLEQRL